MYSKEELQNGLKTSIFGKKIYTYNSIDSTNACAKTIAGNSAEEGSVIISDYQSSGRGRLGRIWQSESGCNLLFSIIVRPKLEINKIGLLPYFAAAGTANALESITGGRFECKWPNDILINRKKCCGILLESAYQQNALDYAVIGIGLNVNQMKFDEHLKNRATSLCLEFGREFDRKELFQNILATLEKLYLEVKRGNFTTTLEEWKSRTTIFGKQITIFQEGENIQGRAVTLTADGGIVIETTNGQRTCYAGDVVYNDNLNNKL